MVLHTALFWLARQHAMKITIATVMGTGMTTHETTGFSEPNHPTLSSIAGMLSILCWFIVLLPQFWANYKRKSGESVSLPFLYIWLLGDTLNLLGATIDNLLLTMRFLAWYYVTTDVLLIGQVYYYRRMGKASSNSDKNSHDGVESSTSDNNVRVPNDEERALLSHNDTQKNKNYHSSATASALQDQTHGSSSSNHSNGRHMSTASEQERELLKRRRIRYALMIILPVLSTVFLLWTLSGQSNPGPTDSDDKYEWLGSALGWCSAMLYLGSRIPQIYKNWRLQSCEGLSIFMFVFSVLGNVTYVASILLNSMDHDYLIKNMPWCLGSGGTLIFDFMIFGQFYLYRHNTPTTASAE